MLVTCSIKEAVHDRVTAATGSPKAEFMIRLSRKRKPMHEYSETHGRFEEGVIPRMGVLWLPWHNLLERKVDAGWHWVQQTDDIRGFCLD